MILYGDYHTHTNYSRNHHGKDTILDNATVAANKGLKQIAITDHGFNHKLFGVRRKDIVDIKEDIQMAKEVTGVDILLGVEANLISLDGTIDVIDEDYEFLDILLLGHHRFVTASSIKDTYKLFYANMFGSPFSPSLDRLNRNTTAFLRALDKYPIDVITHLNYGMPTDTLAVAKMAKQKGTYVELNGKHICFTDREIITMAEEGVKFIVDSDAHTKDRVGECNAAMNLIFRLDIPLSQVVNVDKLPKFKRKRG